MVEIIKAYLHRIETVNPKLNAVVTLAPERAIEEARNPDRMPPKHLRFGDVIKHRIGLPVWERPSSKDQHSCADN